MTTTPLPPHRHLDHPLAQDRTGYWPTVWGYAHHCDDFDSDFSCELGIEYASYVMAPYRPDDSDERTEATDDWFDAATLVQAMFEASFWLARADKTTTFIDQIMSQVATPETGTTWPDYLTREITLRAVIQGSEFGYCSRGHDLDWVWGIWQFMPFAASPVDRDDVLTYIEQVTP